jgi:integrase
MLLSDIQCKNAKAESKPRKMFDGGGLFLQIEPNGSKYWRFKYHFLGKEKRMAFGVYPEVSLAEARGKRDRARKLLSEQIDPNEDKKARLRKAALNAINTFEAIAREWHENQSERWSEAHQRHVIHKLETDIFPYLGKRPIADIDAPELLVALRKIEKRGALHVAKRARGICGQIFRYGIATGRCKRDLSVDLRDALKTKKPVHYSALDIKEMPDFLRALDRNDARLYALIFDRRQCCQFLNTCLTRFSVHILDVLKILSGITLDDFIAMIVFMQFSIRQIKPGTINRQFGIIRHAFDVAMREWEIPLRENPLARLKKLKVNDARSRRIKAEEWEAIKTAATVCRNLLMMPLIRLAIETAMRRGELLAMKWEHINFENRTLLIPVAKNGHSRTIPLTGEAIRILREIQNMKETGSMYVFSGVTGNAANHVWDRIVERAKIENLHFHDLRHEAISRFFEKGFKITFLLSELKI